MNQVEWTAECPRFLDIIDLKMNVGWDSLVVSVDNSSKVQRIQLTLRVVSG